MRRGTVSSTAASGGPGFLLAPQMLKATIHILNTTLLTPGVTTFTFHCSRSTVQRRRDVWGGGRDHCGSSLQHSAPQAMSVVPNSVVLLSGTKVCNLYLQYVLIGPILGAKVCHQLLL